MYSCVMKRIMKNIKIPREQKHAKVENIIIIEWKKSHKKI